MQNMHETAEKNENKVFSKIISQNYILQLSTVYRPTMLLESLYPSVYSINLTLVHCECIVCIVQIG